VQWGIVLLIGLLLILVVLRPAVRQITVTAVEGGMQALPAGAAGAIGALEAGGGAAGVEGENPAGQLPESMVAQLPPDVQAALRANQGKSDGRGTGDVLDDIDLSDIPEELRDNQEAIRQFKLQRLAAKQAPDAGRGAADPPGSYGHGQEQPAEDRQSAAPVDGRSVR
jgi:hypothetical protein